MPVTKMRANSNAFVKICVIITLTSQTVLHVFLLSKSRRAGAQNYDISAVVAMAELLKVIVCSLVVLHCEGRAGFVDTFKELFSKVHMAVPSILYYVQNASLFRAARYLSPTVYIICCQSKVFTTALFSRIILGTRYNPSQIFSFFTLFIGVLLVQTSEVADVESRPNTKYAQGFIYVFTATTFSGFTGVFLERIFKQPNESIWKRNIQLGMFALIFIIFSDECAQFNSKSNLMHGRYTFRGFDDAIVQSLVVTHAAGGLLVAMLMKYTSAVMKCFVGAISICIISTVESLDGGTSTRLKTIGVAFVMMSSFFQCT